MAEVPPARHLLRAKDLADLNYAEPLSVKDLSRGAGLSPAHFSREFKATFGGVAPPLPHDTTAGEGCCAAAEPDWSVARICYAVGLNGMGSFTTSFGRMYGTPPTSWRADFPAAD